MKPVWALLNRHDRERIAVHLFCDGSLDALDAGYRRHADDHVHDIAGLSNAAAAEFAREQELDLLVDLNGYSVPSRLGLYAERPAPVVAGWFNLYATAGIDGIDVLIGDDTVLARDEETDYTERIERVRGTYLCFEVAYPVPEVAPPPCANGAPLVFGSLASHYKLTDATLDAWAEILRGAPETSLLLRNSALGTETTRKDLRGRFAERGIGADRIVLEGPAAHHAFLETYARIDLALDPFPYNGGTTTTEALWQGVPVLSFCGDRWASRTSASLLAAADLGGCLAPDRDSLVARAVAWAHDPATPARLSAQRREMRANLSRSAACDVEDFAREMERLYERIAR